MKTRSILTAAALVLVTAGAACSPPPPPFEHGPDFGPDPCTDEDLGSRRPACPTEGHPYQEHGSECVRMTVPADAVRSSTYWHVVAHGLIYGYSHPSTPAEVWNWPACTYPENTDRDPNYGG